MVNHMFKCKKALLVYIMFVVLLQCGRSRKELRKHVWIKYYVSTLGVVNVTARKDLRITRNPHLKTKYYITVCYVYFDCYFLK